MAMGVTACSIMIVGVLCIFMYTNTCVYMYPSPYSYFQEYDLCFWHPEDVGLQRSYSHLHVFVVYAPWSGQILRYIYIFFFNFFRILISKELLFHFFWFLSQLAVNDPRSGQFSDTQWFLTPMATSRIIYGQLR